MANVQHLEMYSGDDCTRTLYGRDYQNAPYNLTGKTVTWRVGRAPNWPILQYPIFSKTGSVVSAPGGSFTVSMNMTDTQDLEGEYLHQAFAVDNSTGASVVITSGRLNIRRNVEP